MLKILNSIILQCRARKIIVNIIYHRHLISKSLRKSIKIIFVLEVENNYTRVVWNLVDMLEWTTSSQGQMILQLEGRGKASSTLLVK